LYYRVVSRYRALVSRYPAQVCWCLALSRYRAQVCWCLALVSRYRALVC
jgi:hypothetical protein